MHGLNSGEVKSIVRQGNQAGAGRFKLWPWVLRNLSRRGYVRYQWNNSYWWSRIEWVQKVL